ncbi:DnaJ domain-containing protein [Radiomyces spectabilis]|uniref:DnaJ domain-containing protein n=1 Tax=Radiomyces spectabilis TaxID=64574 RepID=UPI002220F505|nr:DnaJ domain-containing protein [Radiomyces spectabilis]KAI8390831.1 DnaJ domain-containing protein [Radiomyces spectabilis]
MLWRQTIARTSISYQRRSFVSKPTKSPFEILSLPPSAPAAEIKKRYYELAKSLHPDNTMTGNVDRFREVVRAYEFLSNPSRREMYLKSGLGWDMPLTSPSPWGPTPAPGHRPASYTNAYWAHDDTTYRDGPWSSHDNPKYMSNNTFLTILAGVSVTLGIFNFFYFHNNESILLEAANRHHWRASKDLAQARRDASKLGREQAVERMKYKRMKYGQTPQEDKESS